QLLLSPHQVVLGKHIDKVYTGYPRTMETPIFNRGCSRSMIGNKERLDDFQAFHGRKVTFRGGEGRITGKGTIRTPTLDFENVYYVKELQKFNDFKLPDDSMVVLKVPRKHNLYTINLNDLCLRGNLACLVTHASFDESMKWHKRMAHVNYKNMNRLVKGNLVRGLPPKLFKNGHTCVAYCKDLVGPTSIRSIDHQYYCLVITDDYSRCDNGTEFKNEHMIELYGSKGIKREYSNPRTPQQNRVTKRKNRTLIEAARTMLADSKLPTMFWTKAADEGYIIGYSASNKAYRVYNVPNKRVEESMNLRFLKEKPNVQGLVHEWYFDRDYLTDSLGYKHVTANQPAGTQGATTNFVGIQADDLDSDYDEQVIIVPSYPSYNVK
nr:hypothetical protein [Tanacetum cinerariifolium]